MITDVSSRPQAAALGVDFSRELGAVRGAPFQYFVLGRAASGQPAATCAALRGVRPRDTSSGSARLPGPSRDAAIPAMGAGELIVAVAGGDREAFGELHRRYRRAMFGTALARLGDRGRAEHAVQEAFTSVWRTAWTYRPERGRGALWLYAVARNAIVSRWRERGGRPGLRDRRGVARPGPAERAEEARRSFAVHRALEALPDAQREPIELAYWGGLSQSEIAERLRVPLGTVKTRTRAVLSRLAEALREHML